MRRTKKTRKREVSVKIFHLKGERVWNPTKVCNMKPSKIDKRWHPFQKHSASARKLTGRNRYIYRKRRTRM